MKNTQEPDPYMRTAALVTDLAALGTPLNIVTTSIHQPEAFARKMRQSRQPWKSRLCLLARGNSGASKVSCQRILQSDSASVSPLRQTRYQKERPEEPPMFLVRTAQPQICPRESVRFSNGNGESGQAKDPHPSAVKAKQQDRSEAES